MEKLERLLNYLEENIDMEHIQEVEKLHLRVLNYQFTPFMPLSVIYPLDDAYTPFPYEEAFDNPEKMLYNELLWSFSSTYNSVRLKDHFPLQIRSNHGVGIIPSLFGLKYKIVNNNMPWVEHVNDLNQIREIIERGIPEFTVGLGAKVLDTYQYFIDKLKEYPKCFKAIHITQPDLQGPFDIAHLMLGSEIFYHLYDHTEVVHKLLELITNTYIGFRKFIEPYLTDKAGDDAVYVHGSIYGGKVIIKDDTAAINLSESMYNEFSKQYNEKIFKAFGKGSLHHCGPERPWHFNSFSCEWLAGINYGNPEMHSIKKTYDYWKQRKVPIIWWGYNQDVSFLKEIFDLGINTGMSLAVKANSFQEAQEILHKHIGKGEYK